MPISRPDAIPFICNHVWAANPGRILDIGIGFGIWGSLFRAYTDIRMAELKHSRYRDWETVIHGIEVHREYESPLWKAYNKIWFGEVFSLFTQWQEQQKTTGWQLPKYDWIHFGDVLEHFELEDGTQLLMLARKILSPGGLISVVTPDGFRPQGKVLDNEYEEHKSGWTIGMFGKVKSAAKCGGQIAVIL